VQRSWKRTGLELGALMLLATAAVSAAASTAVIAGVVRDSRGAAQMGALVEVLGSGANCVGTAFTDQNGRYKIENLVPGRYAVRATAVLFVPAMRENLRLASGMRATVYLTLNALYDPTTWLPAKRRGVDEPDDDWTWTLRSAANRPILRVMGDSGLARTSADSAEKTHGSPVKARVWMSGGAGGFGESGIHNGVALDRAIEGGADAMLRVGVANLGEAAASEIAAGYERQTGFERESRMVVSYTAHPEMQSAGRDEGIQAMRLSSAEKIELGDTIKLEAGGAVVAIRTMGAGSAGTGLMTQPFVRVTAQPFVGWTVAYRMATERELQGFAGLDSMASEAPVAAVCGAKLCTASGRHQEIGVSRKIGGGSGGSIEAAIYRDTMQRVGVAGVGAAGAADLTSVDAVIDTATQSFRILSAGYTSDGLRLTLSEPLSAHLWAELEYESGAAMATERTETGVPQIHATVASAAAIRLQGEALRTGTRLRAVYRWQPHHLVTAVGPYGELGDAGFLSFEMRQAVRCWGILPSGFEATLNVTNLLAEGYQPFLSADGRTLYLTARARTIQAGLSFTF